MLLTREMKLWGGICFSGGLFFQFFSLPVFFAGYLLLLVFHKKAAFARVFDRFPRTAFFLEGLGGAHYSLFMYAVACCVAFWALFSFEGVYEHTGLFFGAEIVGICAVGLIYPLVLLAKAVMKRFKAPSKPENLSPAFGAFHFLLVSDLLSAVLIHAAQKSHETAGSWGDLLWNLLPDVTFG